MIRKLSKIFGLLLIAVIGGYLLFPFWASWLISSNLPDNTTLILFESDYPGRNKIAIRNLVLKVGQRRFSFDNLQLKYDLTDIQIEALKIELFEQIESENLPKPEPFELLSLKIPQLPLFDVALIEKFQSIKVNQLAVIDRQKTYQLTQLKIDRQVRPLSNKKQSAQNRSRIALDLSTLYHHKEAVYELKALLNLEVENNRFTLEVKSNNQPLINLQHQVEARKTRLNMSVNVENLQTIFEYNFPIKLENELVINWLQDNLENQSQIDIDTMLSAPTDLLEDLAINLQSTEDNQIAKNITLPIMLSIKTTTDQPFNGTLNLQASINKKIEMLNEHFLLKLKSEKIGLSTEFSFTELIQAQAFELEKIKLHVSGADLSLQHQQINLDVADYELEMQIEHVQGNINELQNIHWQLNGRLYSPEIKGDIVMSHFEQQSVVQKEGETELAHFSSPMNINFNLTKTEDLLSDGKLLLSQLQLNNPDYQLNGALDVNWQDVQLDMEKGNASLVFEGEQNKLKNFELDSLKVEADLLLNSRKIDGEGKISINQQALVPFLFTYDNQSSRLSLELIKNQLANQLSNHFLAAIGKQNKVALKILEGEVFHSAGIGFDKKLLLESEFAITDMLFQFGDNEIQGLNVSQKLSSLEPLKLQTNISIQKVNFVSGLAINNLTMLLSSQSVEDISIDNLKAELLEGRLFADDIKIGPGGLQKSVFHLSDISLTELIFLMDIAGLYAEGKIDLTIPLNIYEGSPTVNEGLFKATEKGIIKYSSGQDDSQVEENIALQALKNFHYQSLDGTLSYNKASEYHIKLHLLGSNPDLYDGYPIDFVLNLRGELSGIFRSLFLTGNFEEAVMQQVKADQLEQEALQSDTEQQ